MKPIVICIETNDDGQVVLSEKTLREYINEAYEAGVRDGAKNKQTYTGVREPYIRTAESRVACDNLEPEVSLF